MKLIIKLIIASLLAAVIGFFVGFGIFHWTDKNIVKGVLVYQSFEESVGETGEQKDRNFYWSEITNKDFDQKIRGIPPKGFVRPYPNFHAGVYDYLGDEHWNKPKLLMRGDYENSKEALLSDFQAGMALFLDRLKDKDFDISLIDKPIIQYTPIRYPSYYISQATTYSVLPAVIAAFVTYLLFCRPKFLVDDEKQSKGIDISKIVGGLWLLISFFFILLIIGLLIYEQPINIDAPGIILLILILLIGFFALFLLLGFEFARIGLLVILLLLMLSTIPLGIYGFLKNEDESMKFVIAAFSFFGFGISFLSSSLLFSNQLKSELKKK